MVDRRVLYIKLIINTALYIKYCRLTARKSIYEKYGKTKLFIGKENNKPNHNLQNSNIIKEFHILSFVRFSSEKITTKNL